jgi:hypothetical protein
MRIKQRKDTRVLASSEGGIGPRQGIVRWIREITIHQYWYIEGNISGES